MKWSLDEAELEVNTKYFCIGILRRDYFEHGTLLKKKTFWICFLPCIAIRLDFSLDILL